jgi:superfamily I DNA/RNA helicase
MPDNKWAEGLPDSLREIAGAPGKILSVLSGPGTGKTWALIRRAARFLEEGADPTQILVVTFTRTAAHDLRRKIGELENPLATNIDAGTLHSLCFRILQQEHALAATGRVPRPLLKYEADCLLRDLPDSLGTITQRRERLGAFEAAWARLDSDSPTGWPTDPVDQQFKHELETWLRFHRGVLLAELIPLTLSFLRQEATSAYLSRYWHVLVDEYQDLNRAEQVLIDLLAGDQATMSVIGDDDQAIYTTFRNAFPEGVVQFPYRHPGTNAKTLGFSLRCPPNVVSMANAFLTNPEMVRFTDRLLEPDVTKPNAEVNIIRWNTLDREVRGLAKFVKSYCEQGNAGWGDVLVMSPRRQIGYQIRDELRGLGVQASSFFYEEALDNNSARQHFSLLNLFVDIDDRVSLRHWLSLPTPRPASYRVVWEYCNQTGDSPWVALNKLANGEIALSTHAEEIRARFIALNQQLTTLSGLLGKELVDRWLGNVAADPAGHLSELRTMAERLAEEDAMITPVVLRDRLLEAITQPEIPADTDYVRIMSLHKAKGLTAKLVIVAGFAGGLIPFVKEGLTPAEYHRHMQEQRRLFFVALTRATRCLVLSSAKLFRPLEASEMSLNFPRYGAHWVRSSPSPFASQLGPAAPASAQNGDEWLKSLGIS